MPEITTFWCTQTLCRIDGDGQEYILGATLFPKTSDWEPLFSFLNLIPGEPMFMPEITIFWCTQTFCRIDGDGQELILGATLFPNFHQKRPIGNPSCHFLILLLEAQFLCLK
jgi:hypothetical protein